MPTYKLQHPARLLDRTSDNALPFNNCLNRPMMRSWLGRGKSLQFGVTVCCLVAFILYGYEQGVFGPIILDENWLDQFNHPSDSQTGIIVSCYNLGCLLGCFGEHAVCNFHAGSS